MSKFKLHTSVNGHPVGETITVSDRADSTFAKYGDKVEPEDAPENKAITEFETKEKPKRQYNKKQ